MTATELLALLSEEKAGSPTAVQKPASSLGILAMCQETRILMLTVKANHLKSSLLICTKMRMPFP